MKITTDDVPGLYIEERPWGNFLCFGQNVQCTAKVLRVNPWSALSTQFHNNREQVYFFHDPMRVVYSIEPVPEWLQTIADVRNWWWDGNQFTEYVYRNSLYLFKKRHIHGVINETNYVVHVTEVAFGVNDETDICRVYDEYGRTHAQQSAKPID